MSDEPKRGRGRPRRAGADDDILRVARELLAAVGFRQFTVDTIAAQTGIAKTTIYRRWPSKGALVAAALTSTHAGATQAEVVRETEELLRVLGEPDGEIVDVLRALLLPRLAAFGDDADAHRTLGPLLSRYLLGRRDDTD